MADEADSAVPDNDSEVTDENNSDDDFDWYILHTFAGREQEIKERLLDQVEEEGRADIVDEVVVPTRQVMEISGKEKKEVEKQLYPGYVFIRMKMSENNWHFIRQIRGVTGFVGAQMDPIPVEDTEMSDVLLQIGEEGSELEVEFNVGDTVRIISGAMEEMTGTVNEVDVEKAKLHVSVDMFGRSTPVELNFDQAEKL